MVAPLAPSIRAAGWASAKQLAMPLEKRPVLAGRAAQQLLGWRLVLLRLRHRQQRVAALVTAPVKLGGPGPPLPQCRHVYVPRGLSLVDFLGLYGAARRRGLEA